MIYAPAVDAAFARAIAAGAREERPPADPFRSDRMGTLVDSFGHRRLLATRREDVSDDEMERGMAEAFKQSA